MSGDRSWMYSRLLANSLVNPVFALGVEKFAEFACAHPEWMDRKKIKCPCPLNKCQNRQFLKVEDVKLHLLMGGFKPGYHIWTRHGKIEAPSVQNYYPHTNLDEPLDNNFEMMVMDAAGPSFIPNYSEEENPNPDAQKFYDMLEAANKPLFPSCENHSKLSFVSRILNLKAENHLSERGFDGFAQLFRETILQDNLAPKSFYETKKLVRGLGLPVEKLHCCPLCCMIYRGEDANLTACKFCDHARYERRQEVDGSERDELNSPLQMMYYFLLTPRLLRLYASNATATEMRWHAEHQVEEGVMLHPSDSIALKHFNDIHPKFSAKIRNIRLGLCTDGFQTFGQYGKQYSCWPVIVTVYNLPPWMCMKENAMFLTVLVPGPRNPKDKLDVYLQPLISELNQLWEYGVQAYDISRKQNFQLRAALMWTISGFPAYAMLSGWSTAGRMACLYCMHESDAFTLTHSRKQSWFDNHRKFLPEDHPFRRNTYGFRSNRTVTKVAPPVMSGVDILKSIDRLGLKKVTEDDAHETNNEITRK